MRTVIIGAGVVGLATAHELLRAGQEVTVLDAGAYGQGPSHGNAALVTSVLSFPVPAPGTIGVAARSIVTGSQAITIRPQFSPGYLGFLLRMARATTKSNFAAGTVAQDTLTRMVLDGFAEYADEGLSFEQHTGGSMHTFTTRESFEAGVRLFDDFPEIRSRIRVLEGTEAVHEVDPGLAPEISYAYYAPADLQVEPESLMKALVASITAGGGTLREHTEVHDFATAGGKVSSVVTSEGSFDADQVVIAAGVASRGLAARLGARVPVRSGGGYSVDVHIDDPTRRPRTSVMTDTTHIAITPLDRGLRASSGMIIGQAEPTVSGRVIDGLLRDVRAVYPDAPLDDVRPGWAGLRPMSADGVPIIGLLPGWDNTYVATGHAMLGLTYAPPTAKVLRALMEGTAPEAYAAFSPARFGVRR